MRPVSKYKKRSCKRNSRGRSRGTAFIASLSLALCLSLPTTQNAMATSFGSDSASGPASDRGSFGSFQVPQWYQNNSSAQSNSSSTFTPPVVLHTSPASNFQDSTVSNPLQNSLGLAGSRLLYGGAYTAAPFIGGVPGVGWGGIGGWGRGWGGLGGWGYGLGGVTNPVTWGATGGAPVFTGWGGYPGWGGYGGYYGRGWGGRGYGGWGGYPGVGALGGLGGLGGWGGYGGYWGGGLGWSPAGSAMFMGAFGNSMGNDHMGEITGNESVIQLGPSKASGNYYAPSTKDPTASGSYYASDEPAFTRPVKPITNAPTYWGGSGDNPYGKDLNKVPW